MMRTVSALQVTWRIVWRSGLFFVTWAALIAVFFVPFGPGFADWERTSPIQARLYSDSAAAITLLAVTWLMTRFIDRRPFLTIGFATGNIVRDFLAGLAMGVAWLGASLGIAWAGGWASLVQPIGFSWSVLTGASLAMFLNVVAQELLLCGFVFQTIRNRSNAAVAIVASAILFATYHAGAFKGEWLPVVNVFAAGVLLCLAYVMTGNLWLPISIHFAWDVLLGPVCGLTESGKSNLGGGWKLIAVNGPPFLTGGAFGLEGGFIVTLTVMAVIAVLFLGQRRKFLTLFRERGMVGRGDTTRGLTPSH